MDQRNYIDWILTSILTRIVNMPPAGSRTLGRRWYLCERRKDGTFVPYEHNGARLDADRTAKPKTSLEAHLVVPDDGRRRCIANPPADTYVAEDGTKVPIT